MYKMVSGGILILLTLGLASISVIEFTRKTHEEAGQPATSPPDPGPSRVTANRVAPLSSGLSSRLSMNQREPRFDRVRLNQQQRINPNRKPGASRSSNETRQVQPVNLTREDLAEIAATLEIELPRI